MASQGKQGASDLVDLPVGVEARRQVERQARHVAIWHHFKYYILVAVAEGGPERVGRVGGRGSVEHYWALGRVEELGDLVPLAVGGHVDRVGPLGDPLQREGELRSVVPGTGITSLCNSRDLQLEHKPLCAESNQYYRGWSI